MRYAFTLAATVCFAAAILATYATLAAITAGSDLAGYAALMLGTMLALALIFAHAANLATPHMRRVRAMQRRCAFDRARHYPR